MGSVVTKCSTSSSNIQQPRHTSSDKPSYIGVNLDFLKAFAEKEKLQEKAVTGDVVHRIIRPLTLTRKVAMIEMICDGSYKVDCEGKYFGDPSAMISHAWGGSFCGMLKSVEEYVKKKCSDCPGRDPSSLYFLLDIFIINQHQMAQVGHSSTVYDNLVHTLSTMVTVGSEKEMVLAFNTWKKPQMLNRLWCLFEIAVATKNNISIEGSLPPQEKKQMYEEMISNRSKLEQIFTSIDVQKADATVKSDRKFILSVVRDLNLPGDTVYDGFNKLLSNTLCKWLASVNTRDIKSRSSRGFSLGNQINSFKCASAVSKLTDSKDAVEEALDEIRSKIGTNAIHAVHVCVTVAHAASLENVILRRIRETYPSAILHGLTSSGGVMSEHGAVMTNAALSMFAISDPSGVYAVVSGVKCEVDAVRDKIRDICNTRAKDVNNLPPNLILSALSPGPGNEERVLKGVRAAFDHQNVPAVVGGSSADNDLSGSWKQIAMDKITSQGFSLMLCWPTCDLFVRLVSLHNDTERKGKVTEVDGTRCIVSIDNKPAATVYNEWTDGSILKSLGGEKLEGNVLAASTCYPLGHYADDSKYTKPSLIHPANVYENGRMDVFADVRKGETLVCMNASKEQLVDSVEGVVNSALRNSGFIDKDDLKGGLVIYCGGMMMKIGEKGVSRVANSISKTLGDDTPWTGSFTFGEQGPIPHVARRGSGLVKAVSVAGDVGHTTSGNCHGNLMFNLVLFGNSSSIE